MNDEGIEDNSANKFSQKKVSIPIFISDKINIKARKKIKGNKRQNGQYIMIREKFIKKTIAITIYAPKTGTTK